MRGTCAVRFTRRYDAPPAEVWAALTDGDSLARWLGPPDEATVRALAPGRLLELEWPDGAHGPSLVRFELSPDGGGTVLVLDHTRIDAAAGMRALARWERRLAHLDGLVA